MCTMAGMLVLAAWPSSDERRRMTLTVTADF